MFSKTSLFCLLAVYVVALVSEGKGQEPPSELTDIFRASAFQDVEIAAQEPGIVKKLLIKEGSQVKIEQELVHLNRRLYSLEADRAIVEKLIADLEKKSTADREFAKRTADYNRLQMKRLQDASEAFAKSVTQTVPCTSNSRFAGLMSR